MCKQHGTVKLEVEIQAWAIDKLVPYVRNPRKNDAAVGVLSVSVHERCRPQLLPSVFDGLVRRRGCRSRW